MNSSRRFFRVQVWPKIVTSHLSVCGLLDGNDVLARNLGFEPVLNVLLLFPNSSSEGGL